MSEGGLCAHERAREAPLRLKIISVPVN